LIRTEDKIICGDNVEILKLKGNDMEPNNTL